ncbi:MAG: peptide-methionine (S)-S-oxide reductase [Proteobacteria bacterium]|nr:MAG: peptide-methionine (S)-S-oxide reductase [Pseudomonadota bacterium]
MRQIFKWLLILPFTLSLQAQSAPAAAPKTEETAIFAGGCFWCLESAYEGLKGVKAVISGYTGGKTKDPTYKEVGRGNTGHTEAIKLVFDPSQVTYERLLELYWQESDPTDDGGQFVDRGSQYRPEIFYTTPEQKVTAEASKAALQKSGRFKKPLITPITSAGPFYEAEIHHQDYYKKNPDAYKNYKDNSGRKEYLKDNWKK